MLKKNLLSLALSGVLLAPAAFSQTVSSDSEQVDNTAPAAGEIAGLPVATAVALGIVGTAVIVSARQNSGTTGTTGTNGATGTTGTTGGAGNSGTVGTN